MLASLLILICKNTVSGAKKTGKTAPGSRFGYPARVILCNRPAIGAQGVALVELKRLFMRQISIRTVTGRPDIAGKCLNRRSRQDLRQFGQMGTAGDSRQTLFQVAAEILQ